MGWTYGKLNGATRKHKLGFHSKSQTNLKATPIYAAETDTEGNYRLYLKGAKQYKVSVQCRCWATPNPINIPVGSKRQNLSATCVNTTNQCSY